MLVRFDLRVSDHTDDGGREVEREDVRGSLGTNRADGVTVFCAIETAPFGHARLDEIRGQRGFFIFHLRGRSDEDFAVVRITRLLFEFDNFVAKLNGRLAFNEHIDHDRVVPEPALAAASIPSSHDVAGH